MLNPWHDLSPGPNPPDQVTAIIEIPAGSRTKYELCKDTGLLRLDRVLYSAVHYPGDYGFIPRTLHEDNDPLDVLVRINEPTFPGCQIDARPIGVLKMLDKGEPDDKILAVPMHDPMHQEYFDISDLPAHYLKEVEHFFHIYKDLEGKRVEIIGWEKSDVAMQIVKESIARYAMKYGVRGDAPEAAAPVIASAIAPGVAPVVAPAGT
jgi:inorganic pyrophosphatase